MIITRTPFRISFLGGGTDYPAWYRHHGGMVVSTTIDKYCHISCRPTPAYLSHRYRIVYSKIEEVNGLDAIQHKAVRETLRFLGVTAGLEIHHFSDLPARSGMGSSSAFVVGLLNAVVGIYSAQRIAIARAASTIEQDRLHEVVGSQDQIAVAHGGLNQITFSSDGHCSVRRLKLDDDGRREFESHLMLFYTGVQRSASEIAATYDLHNKTELHAIAALAEAGVCALESKNWQAFGSMIHESWRRKQRLSERISSPLIQATYAAAMSGGAYGGKLLGAGGGGFMLFVVPPDRQTEIKAKLAGLWHVPFRLEDAGSTILYSDHPKFTDVA